MPGASHGQRSLTGCHPKSQKESDTTEQLILKGENICGWGVRQLEMEVIWGPTEVQQEDVGSGQRPRDELRWDSRVEAGEQAANRERG